MYYHVSQENPSTRPKFLTRVLDSLPRTFAYLVYIRWVVLSRSEWENLRHANTFLYVLVDLFGQLPRGSMQIGIAGYCVMLFFDFILRFREEVRPFMPIVRVCIGKCCIFLASEMTTPCNVWKRRYSIPSRLNLIGFGNTDYTFFLVCASFFFQIRLLFQLWGYRKITQAAMIKIQELQRLQMMQRLPVPND